MKMTVIYDAVIVGAGFAGLQMLHELRKHGFNVKVIEAGGYLGGSWWWNRYPGARTDTEHHLFQLHTAEISKDFEWSERFADYDEYQRYFRHVDEQHNFSKDIQYNTRVVSAEFDDGRNQWLIKTDDEASTGAPIWARNFILCTGTASKHYIPAFKGLDSFKGQCYHTALWPATRDVDFKGKRVAVIGTGASGLQVIEAIGPQVAHLTVYQRTANITFPMQQVSVKDQSSWKFPTKDDYPALTAEHLRTFSGLGSDFFGKKALDASPEEREAFYESLYDRGGFSFWLGTYQDVLLDQKANDTAYEFWAKKTRARIQDPRKQEILAPKIQPHALGAKRPGLEQGYYEIFNQPNVDLINVRESPILEITPTGVRTEKEGVVDVDILVLATGFDSCTGGIFNISIKNGEDESLENAWKEGAQSYLAISTLGFPNLFFLYGPQTPFSSGATSGYIQSRWIRELLVWKRTNGKARAEPLADAQAKWMKLVDEIWNATLFPGADSWFQGANIPGKPRKTLFFVGGLPTYINMLEESAKSNYADFVVA